MAGSKRGPKTALGKKQSAKNSTTHGLRSEKITSAHQQADYDHFLRELIAFYKPVGPLEKLQLERIATCKVKLKSLQDLEKAKYDLLVDNFISGAKANFFKVDYLTPLQQGMMRELFTYETLVLPCQLDPNLLESLVAEINDLNGNIESDDDLMEYLPKLCAYLDAIDTSDTHLHKKLVSIGLNLQMSIEYGEHYFETAKAILIDDESNQTEKLSPEQLAHEKEIHEHVVASQEKYKKKFNLDIKLNNPPFPNHQKLIEIFKSFRTILQAYHVVQLSKDKVMRKIELEMAALSLPIEEADIFMRYQTAWDRRLSTLMGEFTELQRRRTMLTGIGHVDMSR